MSLEQMMRDVKRMKAGDKISIDICDVEINDLLNFRKLLKRMGYQTVCVSANEMTVQKGS